MCTPLTQRHTSRFVGAFRMNPPRTNVVWKYHTTYHPPASDVVPRSPCGSHSPSFRSFHAPRRHDRMMVPNGGHWLSRYTISSHRKGCQSFASKTLSMTFDHSHEHETVAAITTPPLPPSLSTTTEFLTPDAIEQLVLHWRVQPCINPKVLFPTWICHNGQHIQSLLHSPLLQPYLATQCDLVQNLHVRFRVIRKYDEIVDTPSTTTMMMTTNRNSSTEAETVPVPQSHPNIEQAKFIVLHPATPPISHLPVEVQTLLRDAGCSDTTTTTMAPYVVQFQYHQFRASYLLNQLLPKSVHPVPTAFETVGHVAHLNLKQDHLPYRRMIGEILHETLPNIETVIQKIGDVSGPFRTFQYEVLAGKQNHTLVQLVESGVHLQFDLQYVYWCSRLAEERQRLLQEEIFQTSIRRNKVNTTITPPRLNRGTIVIADVFCGVGALCIQAAMAQSNVEIWANDWNPHATQALQKNAIQNGVSHQFSRLTTVDAYAFLMDLGMMTPSSSATNSSSNTKQEHMEQSNPKLQKVYERRRYHRKKDHRNSGNQDRPHHPEGVLRLPDHVVMNFPLEAPNFLGALRWWPANACGDGNDDPHTMPVDDSIHSNGRAKPRIHVYTFARNSVSSMNEDRDDGDEQSNDQLNSVGNDGRSLEDVAVDLVAENLLPQLSPNNTERNSTTKNIRTHSSRRQELNDVYSCNIRTHIVRDVAPGKVVVCVSFTVTSKLLRHMRGDFL